MKKFIEPSIGCRKKNLEKYLSFHKKPKKEVSFGISSSDYLRFYYKCKKCGHLLAKHKRNLIHNLYEKKYFISTYKSITKLNATFEKIQNLPKSKSDNFHRIKRVKKMAKLYLKKKKINLLDVGSGTGIFPIGMIEKKYSITALEPNKESADFISLKSKTKVKVIHGDFIKVKLIKFKKYDFVTFNKVLEHVEKPLLFLKKSLRLMKKKSLVYIEVPDAIAINDKKEGKNREEFGLGHHHVFTKKSLENLLKIAKLEILTLKQIREPSSKYTLYAFGLKK